jgi:peptidoglycan hydrolase FlgJ
MKISDASMAQDLGLDHISTQVPTRTSIEDTPEAIREAAQTFESLFLNEIMKNMRKTLPEDGLLNQGFANNVFNSMLDQEYSQMAAKSGQLGLADVIARQLGGDPTEAAIKNAETNKAAVKETDVDKTVLIDGEEVPAWALEEIQSDPWAKTAPAISSNDTKQVTAGLSAPKSSEFGVSFESPEAISQKARETYHHLSQPSNKRR